MTIILNFRQAIAVALLFSAVSTTSVVAQVGNDNPTGSTGAFNGSVTTGGTYDPYTANASRSITDLTVPGSVGSYPLAFTRTMNSRYSVGDSKLEFGPAGNWSHNFQWHIPSQVLLTYADVDPEPLPSAYSVNYPDGRRVLFSYSAQDSVAYRAYAGSGISDRFLPLGNVSGGYCYLLLPDGGKIQFTVTVSRVPFQVVQVRSTFTFKLTAIIDPHGQSTSVTYPTDGSMKVQEPAGRQLRLFYVTFNGGTVLNRVEQRAYEGAVATRSVQYHYVTHPASGGQTALSSVVYFGDANLTATYTYQNSNVDSAGRPLLSTANDPMYEGPMRTILYEYATGTGVAHGQILREKHPNGTHVSTLTINGNSRTETRGDGRVRTINYSNGRLVNYSDFKGKVSSISYDGNGFTSAFTDARGKTTTTSREAVIGALGVLTHPDPEQSTRRFAYKTVNGAPYFLQIRGDERHFNSNTYFTLDPVTNRVTKIWYPDYDPNNPNAAPTESFTYNGFGQVETHTMTSGGVENFRYDGRGLKYQSWPPATLSDPNPQQHPTLYYYYTTGHRTDWLERVVDPRGNATSFDYNTRGQIIKVTHQDETYKQNGYNADGTLAWTADENHPNASSNVSERTRYIYDDYKRVVSVTNPLNQTTSFNYAQDWVNSYLHTTSNVKGVFSPLGKQTHFAYDENWRRSILRQAPGIPGDDAWTFYGYDDVGNRTSVQDPRGNVTSFAYDNRNRRISATNPAPFNNEVMRWEYDTRSNLTKEIRPDQSFRRAEYDPMNRVIDSYGFANERTRFIRNLAGHTTQMIDAKNASYGFGYDMLGRKTSATYPADATGYSRTETFWYDGANNLIQYKNPNGQYQYLAYDNRNRRTGSSWNYGGPAITTSYDFASRVSSVVTRSSPSGPPETTVAFGYDNANRQVWEDQTVAGYATHRVEHARDADGNAINTHIPGWYLIWQGYTQRNQLAQIRDGGGTPWFNFAYDVAGNMTKRQAVYYGVNDSLNVPTQHYDPLNRPTMWENTGASDNWFARSWQQYDSVGRMTATWRDEQASKGEHFGYNAIGQLTSVAYNADQVWTGNPLNATHSTSYTLNPLNRLSVTANGTATGYTANGLNQYTAVGGQTLSYDENFNLTGYNGASFTYNAAGQLTSASKSGNSVQFTYDGLGRCLKRTTNGAVILFAFDGWKPLMEWAGDGAWVAYRIYGPGPDEVIEYYDSRFGSMRVHSDVHGNVIALLNYSGNQIEKYSYDAFGKPTITDANGNLRTESAYGNRFMFTGREYIKGLGIYDYRFRHYQPELGRFLQSDPIGFAGGDANLFRYCGGDPVNRSDPFGLDWKKRLKEFFSGSSNRGIATTERVVVPGSKIDGIGYQGPPSVLDYSPTDGVFGSEISRVANDWVGRNHPELNLDKHTVKEDRDVHDQFGREVRGMTSFWTRTIIIDLDDANSVAAYIDILTHELQHANNTRWQHILDLFNFGGNHDQIIFRSIMFAKEYDINYQRPNG